MKAHVAGSLAAAPSTPLAKWVVVAAMVFAVSGCGQKGGLYLPPAAAPAATAASAPAR